MTKKAWEQYEEAAEALFERAAGMLNLSRVEGKQQIKGKQTGHTWQIDAVAYSKPGEKLILVECKHWASSNIDPETVGGFAHRIKDTDAQKGLLVTSTNLSKGAKLVADAHKIEAISLRKGSTKGKYIGEIRDHIFVKLTVGQNLSITPKVENINIKEEKSATLGNFSTKVHVSIEEQE